MGLFSSIKKKATKLIGFIPNIAAAKGIVSLVRGRKKKAKKEFKRAAISAAVIGGTAIAVATGGLAAAAPVVGRGALRAAPKVAKTFFGTVPRAATTVFSAGVIASSAKVRSVLKKAPKTVFTQGRAVGEFIDKPSRPPLTETTFIEKVKTFGVGAGLVAAVAGGVIVAAPLVVKGVRAIVPGGKKKEMIPQAIQAAPQIASVIPPTPEITQPTPGQVQKQPSKPRARRKAAKPIRVSQRVSVHVSQRQSKRYINQGIIVRR